jgi:hypothetical protein
VHLGFGERNGEQEKHLHDGYQSIQNQSVISVRCEHTAEIQRQLKLLDFHDMTGVNSLIYARAKRFTNPAFERAFRTILSNFNYAGKYPMTMLNITMIFGCKCCRCEAKARTFLCLSCVICDFLDTPPKKLTPSLSTGTHD